MNAKASTAGYLFAWRNAAKIPQAVARALADQAADLAWRRRGKGVRRLESNYAKVRPDLSPAEIRELSRAGMRSYLRYYYEAFTLQAATPQQRQERVRLVGAEHLARVLDGSASAVLAIGHMGNWDLAGAWGNANFAPVVTVAERLDPPELFKQFLAFRQSLGMEVLPLGDPAVFDTLVERATAVEREAAAQRATAAQPAAAQPAAAESAAESSEKRNRVIALVADRDLTSRGVEVDLAGHRARIAAGPATVALAAGIDLIPVVLYYERLSGARRKAAAAPWGIVMEAHAPVLVPEPDPTLPPDARRRDQVAAMMQGWADVIGQGIREHTADWHMLQRVFVADLDPERTNPRRPDSDRAAPPSAEFASGV